MSNRPKCFFSLAFSRTSASVTAYGTSNGGADMAAFPVTDLRRTRRRNGC